MCNVTGLVGKWLGISSDIPTPPDATAPSVKGADVQSDADKTMAESRAHQRSLGFLSLIMGGGFDKAPLVTSQVKLGNAGSLSSSTPHGAGGGASITGGGGVAGLGT